MFKNFFNNNKKSKKELNKIALTNEDQINEIFTLSEHKPVLIFKHSTRCGISTMVLNRFETKLSNKIEDFNYFLLDIIQNREVSNFIEDELQIVHQSPQLIVIKNGEVLSHNSHYGIMDVKF